MRGTERQAIRIDRAKWDQFGEGAAELDPPVDRSKLINQYIDWFMRVPGARQPPRRPLPPREPDAEPGQDPVS